MKVRNIVQIATLAGLIATGSAQSMQAIAKSVMRWTGNAIGVGLPSINPILNTSQLIKGKKSIVEKEPDNFRNPTALEQEFLDKHVTSKDTPVKIHKINAVHQSSVCSTDGKHFITVPEHYSSTHDENTAPISLEEAIKTNNEDILSRCTAILQHKNAHKKQRYYDKVSVLGILPLAAMTGAAAGYMRVFMPYNKAASLTRHALSMCGKSLGGVALGLGNGVMCRKILHNLEYDADRKISPEYKDHYAQDIQKHAAMIDTQIEIEARIVAIHAALGTEPDQKFSENWAEKIVEKIVRPPIAERVRRLQQPEPTNLLEKVQRALKKF